MARRIRSIQSKAVSGKIYNLCYRQMLPVLILMLKMVTNIQQKKKQGSRLWCIVPRDVLSIIK